MLPDRQLELITTTSVKVRANMFTHPARIKKIARNHYECKYNTNAKRKISSAN